MVKFFQSMQKKYDGLNQCWGKNYSIILLFTFLKKMSAEAYTQLNVFKNFDKWLGIFNWKENVAQTKELSI